MKKILSLILVVIVALGMNIVVLANDNSEADNLGVEYAIIEFEIE